MSGVSPSVQPFAWLVNDEFPDALCYVQVMRMPQPIFASLTGLGVVPPKIPPIASLHDALAVFAHSILAFDAGLMREDNPDRRWLFLTKDAQIDPHKLKVLIQKWLAACYGDEYAHSIYKTWGELHWSAPERIDLRTADDHLKRWLLPGLAVRWLLNQGYQFTFQTSTGDQSLPTRFAPLMTRRSTAELITEPNGERADHSFVLRFWLDRMPATGEWYLLAKASMRRWMLNPLITEKGFVTLAYGRGKGVYLRRSTGYLDHQPRQDVFARMTLKWYGNGPTGLQWVGKQADVFQALPIGGSLPAAEALARNPVAYQDTVLITMESREADSESPAPGLQPSDHRCIFDDLARYMHAVASPVPEWRRVRQGDSSPGTKPYNRKRFKEVPPQVRRNALTLLPSSTYIDLHVDQSEIATVKRILLSAIGASEQYPQFADEGPLIVETDGRRLEIVCRNDPQLTDPLPESTQSEASTAAQTRRKEIAQRYRKNGQHTGALITLPDYRFRKGMTRRDPKAAIRGGLIDVGCISQFFVPKEERETPERYERGCTLSCVNGMPQGYKSA